LARGFQSVHARHRDIQDHNVRLKLFSVNHRVATVRGIADNGKVGFGAKECADSVASDGIVVNDKDVRALTHGDVNTRYHSRHPRGIRDNW
jgi:hypothetical protein